MARLPQPPITKTPEELHRSLSDIVRFLREIFDSGSKHQGFSQAQIDKFKDISSLGTIVFNEDTQESNVSYFDSGEVKWRSF